MSSISPSHKFYSLSGGMLLRTLKRTISTGLLPDRSAPSQTRKEQTSHGIQEKWPEIRTKYLVVSLALNSKDYKGRLFEKAGQFKLLG